MNPFISIFDETYNPDDSGTYILNIYSNADFLAFSIIDFVRKKFIVLRAFSTDDKFFAEQVGEDACLRSAYRKVNVLYHAQRSLLIPASIATEESTEKVFFFTFEGDPGQGKIVSATVNDSIVCASFVPEQVSGTFKNFPGSRIIHPYVVMIQNAIKNSRKDTYVSCELYKKGIILVCAAKSELLFCNYFECNVPADFAYHVTCLYKNLDLSLVDIPLYYSGIADKKDERILELQRFIRFVKPANATTDYIFSYRFNEIQKHYMSLLYDAHNEDNKR